MSDTVQIGRPVQINIPQTLVDIIEQSPALREVRKVGIIQRVEIVAENRRATQMTVMFIPLAFGGEKATA